VVLAADAHGEPAIRQRRDLVLSDSSSIGTFQPTHAFAVSLCGITHGLAPRSELRDAVLAIASEERLVRQKAGWKVGFAHETARRASREQPLLSRIGCAAPDFVASSYAMSLDSHDLNEFDVHDPEECERCLEQNESVLSKCRCGFCCERLILEASLRDGLREPRIAAECELLRDIGPEPIGYLLNDRTNGNACHFFDRETRLCTIYDTRPLMCRLFDCDKARSAGDLVDLLNNESDSHGDVPSPDSNPVES
jgi:Fe-S-cluster containining protein